MHAVVTINTKNHIKYVIWSQLVHFYCQNDRLHVPDNRPILEKEHNVLHHILDILLSLSRRGSNGSCIRWGGGTLTPPGEYDGSIFAAAAMRLYATITVATCYYNYYY